MKIRTKKGHWGEEIDIPVKGHILIEDDVIYDVVNGEKTLVLKRTPGMWFDKNNEDSYTSFEIIDEK